MTDLPWSSKNLQSSLWNSINNFLLYFILCSLCTACDNKNNNINNKHCGRSPQYPLVPCDHLSLVTRTRVVSDSRITWVTSVPILVFLGLCSRLGPDVRARQTSDTSSLNAPPRGRGIIKHNRGGGTNWNCMLQLAVWCIVWTTVAAEGKHWSKHVAGVVQ